MGKRVIKFGLSVSEIDRAIKEIEKYEREFKKNIDLMLERLVESGVEIARNEVISLGAFDSGKLAGSISSVMYVENNRGLIITNCDYAAFVEFGTGVVGSNSPHPTMPWDYDVNSHGEAGWVYYDEEQGRFRWTKGMPSRPFMYNTAKGLETKVVEIAREVFG